MSNYYEGSRPIDPEDLGAIQLSKNVNHVLGTSETLLTRPGDERVLTVMSLSGSFLLRPGDYRPKTFTAYDTPALPYVFAATAHGFQSGDGPFRLTNSGGALPTELSTGTDYYAVRADNDLFGLAATHANAKAVVPVVISVSGAGTGTHTIAGMPAEPAATTTDGYCPVVLPEGQILYLSAPRKLTVKGSAASAQLQYWWS